MCYINKLALPCLTRQGKPCLLFRAFSYSSGLSGDAYVACGDAASTLRYCRLFRLKALRDMHMAQQFPAAQEQTEAIQHVLPRQAAAASTRPLVAVPSLLVRSFHGKLQGAVSVAFW